MKEITRRLYTKPVMLGMAFLVGMALVVGLFVTAKSTAAADAFPSGRGRRIRDYWQRRNLSRLRGLLRYLRTSSGQVPFRTPSSCHS